MQKLRAEKGITLIALIITIIVMLILVGVSVTVALNGELFTTAKEATKETQIAQEKEELLMSALGVLNQNGKVDLSKLDSSLPEGFSGSNGQYTSKTGNVFIVTEDGTIILEGESSGEEPDKTVTITLKAKESTFKFVYLEEKNGMIYATQADSYTMKVAEGTKIEQPQYLRGNWTETIDSEFPVSLESVISDETGFSLNTESNETLTFNVPVTEIPCWSYCASIPVFEYENGETVDFTNLYANEDMIIFCWDD